MIASAKQLDLWTSRPSKFGTGKTMTVAAFTEFPARTATGLVDVVGSIEVMRRAEGVVKACVATDRPSVEAVPSRLPATLEALDMLTDTQSCVESW